MNSTTAASIVRPTSLSLTLDSDSLERLQNLALLQRRPARALAKEAIEAYLKQEETRMHRNQEADAAWRHYQDTGLHVTGEEAMAWIESWGTAHQKTKPVCRV